MNFIHPALASAFLLVALPLLIHWINLMRHQRVEWAAMKFLQESYRRHRNWIRFKQLILLLMRMAAVALIVAMLAQLITPDQWSRLFGDRVTHHVILLDDSYSMADRGGVARVYDRALGVVRNIGALAASQEGRQIVTLLTFSEAAQVPTDVQPIKSPPDSDESENTAVPGESVKLRVRQTEFSLLSDFEMWLEKIRPELALSELSSGPGPALEAVSELLAGTEVAQRVVYILSDFRANQWNQPAELLETLDGLSNEDVEVCFVRCVRRGRSNLTLSDLRLEHGTNAAGVPLSATARVTNYGPDTVSNVQLRISTIYFDPDQQQDVEPSQVKPRVEPLVVEPIRQIAPGETAVRGVQVYFPKPGYHVVQASLPDDALISDNRRYCTVDLPAGVPVLIIDSDPGRIPSMLMEAVFTPGTRARTGVFPEVHDVAYLRNATAEDLENFHSIYLLNVPKLDVSSVRALENYVRAGGGLCFFLGPDVQLPFYNSLYADGAGLFPLPLEREDLLPPGESLAVPDFRVEHHPIFRIFLGNRNPFVGGVSVQHFVRTTENWLAGDHGRAQVLAELRNGQPLCVDQRFGQGRVVAFLTTVTPEWNNWARNPSFVVALLDLQSYLVSSRQPLGQRRVGTPIDITLDKLEYRSDLSFVVPDRSTKTRQTIDVQAHLDPGNADVLRASMGRGGTLEKRDRSTERSGVYESWTVSRVGDVNVTRYALNVDAEEGDLRVIEPAALADQLGSVEVQLRWWDEFDIENPRHAGYNWHNPILVGLVLLLLAEQAMAYAASYHVAQRQT